MLKKQIFWVVSFLVLSAFAAHAAGFEPGAYIRAVELNGQQIEGTLVTYEGNQEISCLDGSGHYFKLQLKDIKKISGAAGQSVMTGGGSKLPVLNFEMVNGQTLSAGLSSHGIVRIDMGVKGQRNLWITESTRYQYVEVVSPVAGSQGDGSMKVRLQSGQIINVPVKKADVYSITFE